MSEASGQDPVAALRLALAGHDEETVATLLGSVPVGVLVREEQALVGRDGGGTVLPVFLGSDSLDAFARAQGDVGDVRLLRPKELHALLVGLEVAHVVVDPSLESPTRVPGAELRRLLQGEYADQDGQRRLVGQVSLEPDAELGRVLAGALGVEPDGPELLLGLEGHAWAMTRTSRGIDTPSLALADGLPEEAVEAVLLRLRGADLPWPDLEVTQLDPEQTAAAREHWAAGALPVAVS
ncbi:MAG: hypothetical protein JWR42_3 [Marmoricola sp.]|nr:hypothetical protein [Marmoricola sp.]